MYSSFGTRTDIPQDRCNLAAYIRMPVLQCFHKCRDGSVVHTNVKQSQHIGKTCIAILLVSQHLNEVRTSLYPTDMGFQFRSLVFNT